MSATPIAIIEPLINDINSQHVGYFLKTNYFKKLMIKQNFHEIWNNTYQDVKKKRNWVGLSDHEPFDCLDAFILILNRAYYQNINLFYNFTHLVIFEFHFWGEKEGSLPLDELIEDYQLIGFPQELIDNLKELKADRGTEGPLSDVPETIWNGAKLKETLENMDASIAQGKYNLTLTYCYSALEGLFKSYIKEKNLHSAKNDQLRHLASSVKNHISDNLKQEGKEFPEGILNLIPAITNAVSEARNSHSESHFNQESEKWMAELSRDCVHTTGRLVISFLNKKTA